MGRRLVRLAMVLAAAGLVACGGASDENASPDLESEGSNVEEGKLRPIKLTWKEVASEDGEAKLKYATTTDKDCRSKPREVSIHLTRPRSKEIAVSYYLLLCNRAGANLTRVAWYAGKEEAPIIRAEKKFPIYQSASQLPESKLVIDWEENGFSCRSVDGLGLQNDVVCEGSLSPEREAFTRILSQAVTDFASEE